METLWKDAMTVVPSWMCILDKLTSPISVYIKFQLCLMMAHEEFWLILCSHAKFRVDLSILKCTLVQVYVQPRLVEILLVRLYYHLCKRINNDRFIVFTSKEIFFLYYSLFLFYDDRYNYQCNLV